MPSRAPLHGVVHINKRQSLIIQTHLHEPIVVHVEIYHKVHLVHIHIIVVIFQFRRYCASIQAINLYIKGRYIYLCLFHVDCVQPSNASNQLCCLLQKIMMEREILQLNPHLNLENQLH